jgi:hypothetical protein
MKHSYTTMKKISYWLTALVLVMSTRIVRAQGPNLTNFIPPSPEIQAFQKYGDIPVGIYNGIPNISIPIYTVKFRDISVPISLSYHSSGIKVAEDASRVGLGWVLNAGGMLSRNIMGADDFITGTYFNGIGGNNIIDFANGQGPTDSATTGCLLQMFNRSIADSPTIYDYNISSYINANPQFDFQPDQYYYNFNGHSGKFLLLRSMQAVVQNQEKIQINVTSSSGTTWEVKTADGFIYDFNQYESYKDLGTGLVHMTAWYLTKITSPVGNVVTFSYTQMSNFTQTVGSYSETRDDYDVAFSSANVQVNNSGDQKGVNPGQQYYGLLLSSINFPTGKVTFNYSGGRQDLVGEFQLDSVCVFQANAATPFKTIALGYSYFNGTTDPSVAYSTVTNYMTMRLMLASVTEKGYYKGHTILNPPYTFVYNQDDLPAKTSFARDHWGYYNGVTGQSTLIPEVLPVTSLDPISAALGIQGTQRDPNPSWAPAFILTQMHYPTGGYTQFDYESNDFDEGLSEINDFSYFANQNTVVPVTQYMGYDAQLKHYIDGTDTLDLTNEYVLPNQTIPLTTIVSAFRLSGDNGIYCGNSGITLNQMYYELYDTLGNMLLHVDPIGFQTCTSSSGPGTCVTCTSNSPVFSYTTTLSLPPAKYIWKATVGTSSQVQNLEDIHCNFTYYESSSSANSSGGGSGNNITTGGGLRILRITDHDGVSESHNKIRHYIYDYQANKTGTLQSYSYGRRMSKPEYAYFRISADNTSQATDGGGCNAVPYYSAHLMRSSDSNIPLNGSALGAVVGYDQVTELEGENGEYGEKILKYHNNPDVVSGYPDHWTGAQLPEAPPYGSNIPDMNNGQLLEETDYVNTNGSLSKVKDVTNQYTTITTNNNTVYGLVNKVLQTNNFGDVCATVYSTPCYLNELYYYESLLSEWNIMNQSDEKLYKQNDTSQYEENITNYYYQNPAHLQLTKTVTTNSKGELLTTQMQYPLDFTNVSATDSFTMGVANLQSRFIANVPVEKYFQRSNSDGSNLRTTSGVLTYFNSTSPTPSMVYTTQVSAPILNFAAATTSSSGIVDNSTYAPLLEYDSYDTCGNVLQQHKVGDLNTSYLWDYAVSLPICEVRNAVQSDIAYTSFEADGSGNWTISGGSRVAGGITGDSSFALSGASITKSGMRSPAGYIVSYWTSNSGPYSVAGTIAGYPIKGKTINGWTYYEHKISGQSSVTITGGGNIDELRLYPANALMRTVTYSPLIGVTGECDVANRATYYFYDGLGRLSYVKDQDGNIIKTYNYHYQGQTVN